MGCEGDDMSWVVILYHAKDNWQDPQKALGFANKKQAIVWIEKNKPYRWDLKELEYVVM